MHRIHIIITLAFLSFIPSECNAQGIILSQFENAPLNLNPAMTGNFEGNHRVSFNYRNQWSSYQTGILSYDTHLDLKSNDQIGLGFSGTHDVAGSLNFRTSNFSLLSSYIHYFGDRFKDHHSITLGSSLALGNKKIDSENANWPDQEPLQDTLYSKTFFNFSSGIKWDYCSNSLFGFQMGLAVHNINTPDISFFNANVPLAVSTTLHGNIQIPLSKKILLSPSFLYNTQNSTDLLVIGSAVKYLFHNSTSDRFLQLGIWTNANRDSDTSPKFYTLGATGSIKQLTIGLSYDRVNLGGGTIITQVYEFSLSYIFS